MVNRIQSDSSFIGVQPKISVASDDKSLFERLRNIVITIFNSIANFFGFDGYEVFSVDKKKIEAVKEEVTEKRVEEVEDPIIIEEPQPEPEVKLETKPEIALPTKEDEIRGIEELDIEDVIRIEKEQKVEKHASRKKTYIIAGALLAALSLFSIGAYYYFGSSENPVQDQITKKVTQTIQDSPTRIIDPATLVEKCSFFQVSPEPIGFDKIVSMKNCKKLALSNGSGGTYKDPTQYVCDVTKHLLSPLTYFYHEEEMVKHENWRVHFKCPFSVLQELMFYE
jgi:hypothetical protein